MLLENRPRRWWIAGLLGIASLGLGQLYNGQPRKIVLLLALAIVVLGAYAALANTERFMVAMVATVAAALIVWLGSLIDAVVQSKRQEQSYELRPYNRVIVYVVYGLAVATGIEVATSIVKNQFVQAFRIPSGSMSPTLLPGDYVLADKRPAARRPSRGDIAVFRFPKESRLMFLDRVVGVGGDTLELRDKALLIGSEPVPEPFTVHLDSEVRPAGGDPRDNFGPTVVPAQSYFVMGDNRDNSNDSRYWGPLPEHDVIGTVRGVYFSQDPQSGTIRWERIGRRPK